MRHVRGLVAALVLIISIFVVGLGAATPEGRADAPAGQMTWANP